MSGALIMESIFRELLAPGYYDSIKLTLNKQTRAVTMRTERPPLMVFSWHISPSCLG